METLGFLFSPLTLAALLAWNFAVLSAVQLTVRLIGAYAPLATARSALLLTLASLPIGAAVVLVAQLGLDADVTMGLRARGLAAYQAYVFQQRLTWFPLAVVLTAVAGFVIIRKTLRFKRTRSALVAALGIGILSAPWAVFLRLPS
jgi:hypothetical protein